jgi:anti-sigma-K factor RskA
MNDESTLFDLLPAYALGALSGEERAQVETFLATSEAARAELRNLEAMLTGYAALTPARKAPAHLTDDFRRRLAAENAGEKPPTPPQPIPTIRPFPVRRVLLGLAAVFGVVLGIFAAYRLVASNNEAQTIQDILKNPNAQWIALNPQRGTAGKVSLVTVPDRIEAVLVTEQVPGLPYDKQYQLWLVDAEGRDNGGVFSADQPVNRVLIRMPGLPKQYKRLGITVEPRGGSPGPTSPAVFSGEFPQ